jgi:fimbrial chaperone protein
MNRISRLLSGLGALAAAALTVWAPALVAGEFTILPLRVSLDRTSKAAEVVVRNEGRSPLRMQVEAMSWRQDAEGSDRYEPAEGLIFFPRSLEIPPGESRVVRVGVRSAPVTSEETYRLFIEELPPAETPATSPGTTTVRVLLRVGVAVFVAPLQHERTAAISKLELKAGQVQWAVANAGTVHFVADRVELAAVAHDGTRLHVQQYQERYFLAGVEKPLRAAIPRDVCPKVASIEAIVAGENVDLRRKIDVEPGACS